MRVGLDISARYMTQAGTARYLQGLRSGLERVKGPDLEIQEIAWRVSNFEHRQPQKAFKTAYREIFWNNVIGPRIARRDKCDVLHTQAAPIMLAPRGAAWVATLHDLAVLRYPHRYRGWGRFSAQRDLRKLIKMDRLICISEFTASEAKELLGIERRQIEVIYNGCDFHDASETEAQKPEFAVPPDFFLFVGSLEPGKNLALLREVYSLAEKNKKPLPDLMIVGARWAGVASEGKPPENWHYLGRQPDAVLLYLYRHAQALLFPSIYEGFGLPVAEAMVTGCPVICSPVASLPEVGGDAALYCPHKPEAYLKSMMSLISEKNLRSEMVEKGKIQGSKFTWTKCAKQVEELYRAVVQ